MTISVNCLLLHLIKKQVNLLLACQAHSWQAFLCMSGFNLDMSDSRYSMSGFSWI